MQSAGGEIHLLPALPAEWQNGSIKGLRAIGGFEITNMEWKDARLVKLVIKSNLGGNLRLRVPNAIRLSSGSLKKATGKNPNAFFVLEETPEPIISSKANITWPQLRDTRLYDITTRNDAVYTFLIANEK
ncbi:MAG TPA: glycoside hydrolase family 95 protein, partial [Chitinophagaceae bacterium]|nr:glycoside hydrolase family 95 protein [Chitinophagaceae bacterium]